MYEICITVTTTVVILYQHPKRNVQRKKYNNKVLDVVCGSVVEHLSGMKGPSATKQKYNNEYLKT